MAPTYRQAKRIAWKPLKQLTKEYWASKPNETDLSIELTCGGTIALRGADNYDNLRGDGLDFVVLDEYASMAPAAWTEVLRPALSDRLGRALFIGTPKGFNHFYDLYQNGQAQAHWEVFRYTTEEGGNVPVEELQSASSELDERTYRQEFQASFENLSHGIVYFAFSRADNVRERRAKPRETVYWSLDFNVDPMSSVLCQVEDRSTAQDLAYGRPRRTVHVIDEIVLPNSNTAAMCEAFAERVRSWGSAQSCTVRIYGDAAGSAREHGGTIRLRNHPAVLPHRAGLSGELSLEEFEPRGAGPGQRRQFHAAQQSANAFWTIPRCSSKRSNRRRSKRPSEPAPNCCAIWKWR